MFLIILILFLSLLWLYAHIPNIIFIPIVLPLTLWYLFKKDKQSIDSDSL